MLEWTDNVVMVFGDARFAHAAEVERQLRLLPRGTHLLLNDYTGPPWIAAAYAYEHSIPFVRQPTNWDKFGDSAMAICTAQLLTDYTPNAGLGFYHGVEPDEDTVTVDRLLRESGATVRLIGRHTGKKKLAKWRKQGIYHGQETDGEQEITWQYVDPRDADG